MWRTSVLRIWHIWLHLGPLSSGLADDEILSSCFDDIYRQGLKAVDRWYAFHLSQQANEQAKVSACRWDYLWTGASFSSLSFAKAL